jgi:hypothetical protein
MESSANFSPCRCYRYALWRNWGGNGEYIMFVGLNPSTADETQDDPTIRRCLGFADSWGYSGLCVTNLFAYRTSHPADLKHANDPIGPDNDQWLRHLSQGATIIIAAWGVQGQLHNRDRAVCQMLPRLHYLRLTKDGYPSHPLYLPKTLQPIEWKLQVVT